MLRHKINCAIIVNDKGQLILVKRGRDPFKDSWALVSGIGESLKGIPPEIGIHEDVRWDLGTESFKGEYAFSVAIENDPRADETVVFVGTVDDSEITMRPGFSLDYKWVDRTDTKSFENLAFEHSQIVQRYLNSTP